MTPSRFLDLDASAPPFSSARGEPPSGALRMHFDGDGLVTLRREVMSQATAAGLSTVQATRMVTAVNEIASNSVIHGGGGGTLRLWSDGDTAVAEVSDSGVHEHPPAVLARSWRGAGGGRGLWLANELCDLVQIRTLRDATVVRLHMNVDRGAS